MSDQRLIEDYLPIEKISAEASREKSLRHGHISTIHLWWARRPLVACRAAVYASLVPANQHAPQNGPENKRASLARANAAKFLDELCRYPGNPLKIEEARKNIRQAHKARTGKDEPPKVLDCFAGGGAIPLEALRLGCEAYALDLNPVAHIVQLCTLVYPQKYGQPDPHAVGCDNGRWAGLAREVEHWGKWVLERVRAEIGDIYPPIPDPSSSPERIDGKVFLPTLDPGDALTIPSGNLTPVAYLWTRTVPCKITGCGAIVPLVRQTWLCKKAGRYIALRVSRDETKKVPGFTVVRSEHRSEAKAIEDFGFDPGKFSKAGNAACVFCGTVADSAYVKQRAQTGKMDRQLMAVVATRPGAKGKNYFGQNEIEAAPLPNDEAILGRIKKLCAETGLTTPDEPMDTNDPTTVAGRGFGITKWHELFTPRQLLALLTFVKWVRQAAKEMKGFCYDEERLKADVTYLGLWVNKIADFNTTFCSWINTGEKIGHTFARQAIPMVWDFADLNPLGNASGNAKDALKRVLEVIAQETDGFEPARSTRGSAAELPYPSEYFDAVITDPPYYDNISYAALSDFFYVWLKRNVGDLYPEHFGAELTPKKGEVIADTIRHGGKNKAKIFYEDLMRKCLYEINRVLKPNGILAMVYAHKTVAGWSTLINALRQSSLFVVEAWPLDTEKPGRLLEIGTSALASSIFIVCRKRNNHGSVADYRTVKNALEEIVQERVKTLWEQGITGADLIIACVGAGLKAFTQYEKVERESGEEILPERFLTEVEGVVQETILAYLFGSRAKVSSLDAPTRFYVLWRYAYGRGEIDAGEAIVFSYPLNVELDGPKGLGAGRSALLEKRGKKYRLRDFAERGQEDRLGLDAQFGLSEKPLVDVLHRLLWLMENRTLQIGTFLDAAMPHAEELRLVAQALSGSSLQGGGLKLTTDAEQGALQKLLSNWESIIDDNLFRKK